MKLLTDNFKVWIWAPRSLTFLESFLEASKVSVYILHSHKFFYFNFEMQWIVCNYIIPLNEELINMHEVFW